MRGWAPLTVYTKVVKPLDAQWRANFLYHISFDKRHTLTRVHVREFERSLCINSVGATICTGINKTCVHCIGAWLGTRHDIIMSVIRIISSKATILMSLLSMWFGLTGDLTLMRASSLHTSHLVTIVAVDPEMRVMIQFRWNEHLLSQQPPVVTLFSFFNIEHFFTLYMSFIPGLRMVLFLVRLRQSSVSVAEPCTEVRLVIHILPTWHKLK